MIIYTRLLQIFCVSVTGVLFSACFNVSGENYGSDLHPQAVSLTSQAIQDAYSFQEADAFVKLKGELEEISGITLFDANHLAAIQDEKRQDLHR